MSKEGTKTMLPHQSVFCCGWDCRVSAPYSYLSYKYEAQLCISVNIFSHFNYLMQKNILFIAYMIYIEYIVMSRPMTFHNYNTCTSLLQYTRLVFDSSIFLIIYCINTSLALVNMILQAMP